MFREGKRGAGIGAMPACCKDVLRWACQQSPPDKPGGVMEKSGGAQLLVGEKVCFEQRVPISNVEGLAFERCR